jgi:arabinofuranan 3-O-arabinosyltransferase
VFYGLLADDSVDQVGRYLDLDGRLVADVGSGAGYFASAFRAAGARCVCVDADIGELAGAGRVTAAAAAGTCAVGRGEQLPLRSAAVDLAYSSNLVEHVADPWRLLNELIRITRPGGMVIVGFTNWLSPWGGHETSPWHYLGGDRAARRYERRHGRPPKNRYGQTLFPVGVAETLRWARQCPDAELVDARPRYLPDGARAVLRLPGLREFATWNLLVVLRRPPAR